MVTGTIVAKPTQYLLTFVTRPDQFVITYYQHSLFPFQDNFP